jgi:hypothetical protein
VSAACAGARPGLRQHVRAMAVGVGLGLVSTACAAPWADADAGAYVGVLLAAIGAIYFGFAVGDGRPSAIAVQVVSASCAWTSRSSACNEGRICCSASGSARTPAGTGIRREGPTRVRTWWPLL